MNTFVKCMLIWLALCASSSFAQSPKIGGESKARQVESNVDVSFSKQIRPIFNKHCTACHGGVKQAADISFAYKNQVLPPDGWIVEPGNPEDSELIVRVTSDDPDERMPPGEHGAKLSKHEIELLTQWIREGAKWEEHWAYAKPLPQSIPPANNAGWCRQPMDSFILSRLDKESFSPSPDATPERWLRRVSLDLIGLPPTLQQRSDFLNDVEANGEAAYSKVVDRLLASPQYGERWASVWLDQVRYADSKGLGIDSRRNVWKYRDWVIDAFNSDMPYDQFTIKQIAGDLLPDRTIEDQIATAAHRLTQTNEEGGTDDEEFRVAAILDRVNTTWQTWQGVTFGCIQCHSHPYDPIRHEEFYEFAAFFNNTADCDLNEDWPTVQAPLDPADYALASELDDKINTLRDRIWQQEYLLLSDQESWQPLVQLKATSNKATKLGVETKGDHDEFFTVDTISKDTDIILEAQLPEKLLRLTAIRFTGSPLDPQTAIPDSEWGFVLSHVDAQLLMPGHDQPQPIELSHLIIDEPNPFLDPQESLNSKSNQGFATYTRIHYPREAALVLKSPLDVPTGSSIRLTLRHRYHILASFSLVTRRGHIAVSDDLRFSKLHNNPAIVAQKQELVDLKQQRSSIKSTSVPVLQELGARLSRPTYVFQRGLFLTKDKQVFAGTPDSFPSLPANMPANRLALAKWMTSPENPLTARVAVNRIWARLFGTGIVATEEDFGSSGTAASHPQLLDFLALRFQNDYRWSTKRLIRDLVLSSTYRQSSIKRADLLKRDPRNRLLASGPRFRLPSETIRDQSLALSGLLNAKMFGPPVRPFIPDGVWKPFDGSDKWDNPKPDDENRYRRSIYTYTKRSIPYPMFASFDSPSREFCTPRRLRSNTPVQALMTLNDETFVDCAVALGKRMIAAEDSTREQVRHGFLLATCREPNELELDELVTLAESSKVTDDTSHMTPVAAVLLNLDEVIMK